MADIGIDFRRASDNKKQTVWSYVLVIAAAVNQSDDQDVSGQIPGGQKITKEEESIDKRFVH